MKSSVELNRLLNFKFSHKIQLSRDNLGEQNFQEKIFSEFQRT